MWHLSFPCWQFIARAAVVYIAVIVLLRLGGKRQVGQMGVGELVAILLISNAVQNSMNGGDNSITGGVILASVIIALSIFMEYATFKSKRFENLIQGRPTLLIHHGKMIEHNLDKERLSPSELKTILRRQGIHDIHEVAEAILESDGYVSVTKYSDTNSTHD
ncbi:MAG: YetF domain-containing protein [Armatimonadota bacterium]